MIMVIDCETTGLPADFGAPAEALDNWPRAVEIAWGVFTRSGELLRKRSHIIFPQNYEIPEAATAKHGITTVQAQTEGIPLHHVLGYLAADLYSAELVVGHNIAFDAKVIGAEFLRAGWKNLLDGTSLLCTMVSSTDFCGIRGPHGNKWPRLSELYAILFDGVIEGEHRAEVDMLATAKCYFELVKRGVIQAPPQESDPEPEAEPEALFTPHVLFTPLELQGMLRNAYNWQARARLDLFNAARAVDECKRALLKAQNQHRQSEAYASLRNEDQRKAYIAEQCAAELAACDTVDDAFSLARLAMDNATSEVEQARAMLRVAELAAAMPFNIHAGAEVMV